MKKGYYWVKISSLKNYEGIWLAYYDPTTDISGSGSQRGKYITLFEINTGLSVPLTEVENYKYIPRPKFKNKVI